MIISTRNYRLMIEATTKVLKKRFNNLSAEELLQLAADIVDANVEILDKAQ